MEQWYHVKMLEKVNAVQDHIVNTISQKNLKDPPSRGQIFLNKKTLRLRAPGKKILCRMYDHYEFTVSGVTSGDLIILFRQMQYPYYLHNGLLVLFSEKDAFVMKLGGFEALTGSI